MSSPGKPLFCRAIGGFALCTVLMLAVCMPIKAERVVVIGHRGASGYLPEHTLAAYFVAIQQGADYIEPDLVLTRDGVLVARHENEISGTTDVASRAEFAARRAVKDIDGERVEGWFTEDFTLAELKTLRARERLPELRPANTRFDGVFEIPTFEEILTMLRAANDQRAAAAKGRRLPKPATIGVYPETKHPTYFRSIGLPFERELLRVLAKYGYRNASDPVFIQSFEVGNLQQLRKQTRLRLVQLVAEKSAPFDWQQDGDRRTYADMLTTAGLAQVAQYADAIGPHKELVVSRPSDGSLGKDTGLARAARAAGLGVHVWTLRAENHFLPANLRSSADPAARGDVEQELAALLDAGVTGVFADYPDIATQVRDARKPSASGRR
jgi:glycerophosphoryl diester phosphodiesterase